MINKANDVYNRWLNGQEALIIKHDEELEAADKVEPLRGPVTSKGQVTHLGQFASTCRPSTPQTQALPVPDPFAGAHQSLVQCIHDVHERAKGSFPSPSQHHCSSHPSSYASNHKDHSWHSWNPLPEVGSPVLSEIINFSKDSSLSYERLQPISPSNGTGPALQTYFHLTPSPPSVYGDPQIYEDGIYPCTSLPQDGPRPSSLPFSTSSSSFVGIDPVTFELGPLNTDPSWMAFF